MLSCGANQGIVQCFECFDYRNRLWIFLEIMEGGAITPMLEDMEGKVSEEFCKWICH